MTAASPRRLQAGNRIDRYEILRVGDRDTVWAARDVDLGRDVDLELVDPERQRVAQVIAGLAHPNLVAIHDIGKHDDRLFIATERLPGTLRAWLATPRSWPEVVDRFVQAGRGLAALHRAGLTHPGIDLDCLRLTASHQVRVGSLALAMAVAEREDGLAADQQAFCAALDRALVGVSDGPPPARFRTAVARGLAPDPTGRWPSMDALLAALAPPRRRRSSVVAAVVLVAVAALVLTTWWWLRKDADADSVLATTSAARSTWKPVQLAREVAGPASRIVISHDGTRQVGGDAKALWIQARGDAQRRPLPLPPAEEVSPVGFAPDDRSLFLMADDPQGSAIWQVVVAEPAVLRRIASVPGSAFVDVSPDGAQLLVSSGEQTSGAVLGLLQIDVRTGVVRTLIAPGPDPIGLAVWAPDGRSAACLRTSELRVDLLQIDLASAGIRVLRSYRVLSERLSQVVWRTQESLVLVVEKLAGESSRSVITEVDIRGGVLGEARELYSSPEYTNVALLELTDDEAFFSQTSWGRRTMILDLREPAAGRRPRFLDSGSRSDDLVTGWTASGRVVLAVDMTGNLDAIQIGLDGEVEPLLTTWWNDTPQLVLGDDVWLPAHAPGDPVPVCTLTRRSGGRTTTLAEPACLPTSCAGDRRRPCLAQRGRYASDGTSVRTFHRWDPDTGHRDPAVVATVYMQRGDRDSALSADGKRLAVARAAGWVDVIDLATGAFQRVGETRPPAIYQFVTWDDHGEILATRIGERQELVRIARDGTVTEVFSSPNLWLANPRLSHDGRYIAVTATDMEVTYWSARL